MMTKKPIWIFDKVEITYLQPIIENGNKSKNRCHASIDFGFFYLMDVGITLEREYDTLEREYDNRLIWSNDFGWSQFKFAFSQIDNPYVEEVTKVARMVKEELDRKKDVIIDFLDDPNTMPFITR